MNRWRWLLLLLIPAGLAGGVLAWGQRPLAVTVAGVERDVPLSVFGLGTVEARILSRIGFEIPGTLVALEADHGDQVAQGAVLARLNDVSQQARLARAEATVLSAEAQQGRVAAIAERAAATYAQKRSLAQRRRELAQRGSGSLEAAELAETEALTASADLAVARADITVAQALLADARANLGAERATLAKHSLVAPFDAVVIARNREAGAAVQPGEAIFTLIAPGSLWALAHVDEARAGRLREGQPAEVRLRSLPGEVFPARVVRIGLESDRVTEERRVWLSCERCPERPVLGEQLQVEIETGRLAEARLVPEAAITGFDGAEGRGWVLEAGRLHQRPLRFVGRTLDARLVLEAGSPAVVTRILPGFREGRAARVSP